MLGVCLLYMHIFCLQNMIQKTIDTYGRIDCLINNVGTSKYCSHIYFNPCRPSFWLNLPCLEDCLHLVDIRPFCKRECLPFKVESFQNVGKNILTEFTKANNTINIHDLCFKQTWTQINLDQQLIRLIFTKFWHLKPLVLQNIYIASCNSHNYLESQSSHMKQLAT